MTNSRRLRATLGLAGENLPGLFTGFFHEDPHLGMGGFEVNGEMMVPEPLAGNRADRGDHGVPQGVAKTCEFIGGAEQFHGMIDLGGAREQHNGRLSIQNAAKRPFEGLHVVGQGPAVHRHTSDLSPPLGQPLCEIRVGCPVFLNGNPEPGEPFGFAIIQGVEDIPPGIGFGHGDMAVSYTHLTLPTIYSV